MFIYNDNIIDIGLLLYQLNLQIEDKGDSFLGRCPNPSHLDSNPSWRVYKNTGHHVCFSCGFKGSLNHLVKFLTGKSLQDYIKLDNVEDHTFKNAFKSAKEKLIKANQKGKFEKYLNDKNFKPINRDNINDCPRMVRDYIQLRRLSIDFIEQMYIGYCLELDINGTFFKDRLLIPIYYRDEVVNIEGRDLTQGIQKPKVLYPKEGLTDLLYNWEHINKSKAVILVEGIIDYAYVWTHIDRNVTCLFGNQLAPNKLKLLSEAKHIIVIPDNDDAGKLVIKQLDEGLNKDFDIALLPKSKDAGEAPASEISDALRNKISSTQYFMEKNDVMGLKQTTLDHLFKSI